jgi:hypothetical protein
MTQLDAQAGSGLTEFLKGWGSLIVATIALVQPWAIGVWRRMFRPGFIDIHETGSIEVGYSAFGPTIGLRGTMRAVHRDQFVRQIDLKVTKLKDGSTHHLDWIVFRAEKLTADGTEDSSYEVAAGFILLTTQPYRYSILFGDSVTRDEMKPHIEKVQAEWNNYTRGASTAVAKVGSPTVPQPPEIFEKYLNTGLSLEAYNVLDRRMYWEAGKYYLGMYVRTTRPEDTFRRGWTFELTEEDFKNLRVNAAIIIRAACSQPGATVNFAYPQYQREPNPLGNEAR